MLIKSGADVNATMQNGETALHVAARSGALRMVQILLTEKADTSGVGISGETPLHVAVRNCNYHVAKELLEHSASQKSKSEATGMVNAQNSVIVAKRFIDNHFHVEFQFRKENLPCTMRLKSGQR